MFLYSGPDESTLQKPEIIEKIEYHQKTRLGLVLHFFSLFHSNTLPLSTTIFYISSFSSCISTFHHLGLFVSYCFAQMPIPCSCLFPSLSLFLILHGFSPLIHPGQATIPYKASGSSHLASYFHIRSAVTDRVYTGSSPECEAASTSAVPQTLLCSLLLDTNLVTPHPFSLFLLFLQLYLLSPLFPHISAHISLTHLLNTRLYPSSFPCISFPLPPFLGCTCQLFSSVGILYF